MVLATLACGAAQAKDGQNAATILGGVAVGAVGGAVLGTMLNNRAPATQPVYVQPAPPPPAVVEVEPYRPVRHIVASPYDDQAYSLKGACDHGSRSACIRFGIMIGKHQERVATWRRTHPDFFSYED
jgi:hypothetical protein